MLARLLQILLPNGGMTVHMAEAYFDESGSHDGSPVLCVAGYIVEKDSSVKLDDEWASTLERYRLPFFRMSACAHGTEPFHLLTKAQRVEVEKELIAIIRKHVSFGVAVTLEPQTFDEVMPNCAEVGSPYTFCAHNCLVAVKDWADRQSYLGKVAYFFESGHRSATEANKIMNRLVQIPGAAERHRYGSHTFALKQNVRPLQAADFLAWQCFTNHEHMRYGKPPRKDFVALTARRDGLPMHKLVHWNRALLQEMAAIPLRNSYPLTYPYPN